MADWYAVLQLSPQASTDEIAQAVEKRSRQASALANTNPERSQQLREQIRAIKRALLSGDEARSLYDATLAAAPVEAAGAAPPDPGAPANPHQQHWGQQHWGQQHSGQQQSGQQQWGQQQSGHQQQAPAGGPMPRPQSGNRFLRFMQSGYTCQLCGEGYLPGSKFCTRCCAQLVANASYVPVVAPVTNPNACAYCGTVAALTHAYCRNCGATRPTGG